MVMRSHLKNYLIIGLALATCAGGAAYAQYPGFDDPGTAVAGGSGGLVPAEEKVDGGEIPIGASAQVVVRFRNEGGQPAETGLIRLYPSSNISASVALNQCKEEPLPSGAECAIALQIKGLQSGPWRVEMLMSHNGRSRLVTARATGNVQASDNASDKLISDIEMIPDEVDFGSLSNSQTLVEPVILRNITSNEVDISDIYIDSSEQSGYALKTECTKLAAGQACIATVTWSPKAEGKSSGVLVIKHSGPTSMASVPLKGEYTPDDAGKAPIFPKAVPGMGLLVSSQEELDFGSGVSTASAITISLVNSGDAPITLQDVRISGSDNGLGFKDDGCKVGTTLAPIEACPLTVTWSPTRVGELYDDIQILHSGARGVLVVPVRGTSTGTVSQDQKAIMLTQGGGNPGMMLPVGVTDDIGVTDQSASSAMAKRNQGGAADFSMPVVSNPASVLDGFKITSFSPTRAIINGPGGSRIVFDNEETVLGGVEWMVLIQKNGIEFAHQDQRVLLLFDRSLSSINRVNASSKGGDAAEATTEAAQDTTGGT